MPFPTAVAVVALMVAPTAVVAAASSLPRVATWVGAVLERPGPARPTAPPIERQAADLRRLLAQHEALTGRAAVMMRAHHRQAVEIALTEVALEAAAALDVPWPDVPHGTALPSEELAWLLHRLQEAGLALPPSAGLLPT
jgi:hypothetical protein